MAIFRMSVVLEFEMSNRVCFNVLAIFQIHVAGREILASSRKNCMPDASSLATYCN